MSNPLARTVRTSPRVAPSWHKAQQHLISVVNDANIIICSCDFWKRKLVIFSKQPRGGPKGMRGLHICTKMQARTFQESLPKKRKKERRTARKKDAKKGLQMEPQRLSNGHWINNYILSYSSFTLPSLHPTSFLALLPAWMPRDFKYLHVAISISSWSVVVESNNNKKKSNLENPWRQRQTEGNSKWGGEVVGVQKDMARRV